MDRAIRRRRAPDVGNGRLWVVRRPLRGGRYATERLGRHGQRDGPGSECCVRSKGGAIPGPLGRPEGGRLQPAPVLPSMSGPHRFNARRRVGSGAIAVLSAPPAARRRPQAPSRLEREHFARGRPPERDESAVWPPVRTWTRRRLSRANSPRPVPRCMERGALVSHARGRIRSASAPAGALHTQSRDHLRTLLCRCCATVGVARRWALGDGASGWHSHDALQRH